MTAIFKKNIFPEIFCTPTFKTLPKINVSHLLKKPLFSKKILILSGLTKIVFIKKFYYNPGENINDLCLESSKLSFSVRKEEWGNLEQTIKDSKKKIYTLKFFIF